MDVPSGSENTAIGNIAENDVVDLLKTIPNVVSDRVRRDVNNSHFDVYFSLENESFERGLQVKSIRPKKSGYGYSMDGVNKYKNGMLIVGINKAKHFGLAYIKEDKHHKKSASITPGQIRGVFSQLVLNWIDFRKRLIQLLPHATVITQQIFEKSLTKNMLLSYNSIERFAILCKIFSLSLQIGQDTSSVSDAIFEGKRAQFKYKSAPSVKRDGAHRGCYNIGFSKNGPNKTKVPYEKGDNDFYIIELGTHHGDFLILLESQLIEKGNIKVRDQTGRIIQSGTTGLSVFPYNYLEIAQQSLTCPVRGNWTCDGSIVAGSSATWISTTKGLIKLNSKSVRTK